MKVLAGSVVALVILTLALLALNEYGRSQWAVRTQTLLDALEVARLPSRRSRYQVSELEGLPVPVQRYFLAVLKDRQPIVTAVTVQHTGTFNVTGLGAHALWLPFTSQQRVVTHRPGFVWNARMAVLPGVAILVHDAYASGVGTLHPSVWGLFALTHQSGTGDIARGELMRYMMEAAWYPTALLPSQGTTWRAVDASSADATMVDADISMTMRFTFGADGLMESARADSRGALIDGKVVMLPWAGRMSNYQERGGMRVPLTAEAAWLPSGENKPYWRGTITSAVYEWAQ
jgi:hypothetical protein